MPAGILASVFLVASSVLNLTYEFASFLFALFVQYLQTKKKSHCVTYMIHIWESFYRRNSDVLVPKNRTGQVTVESALHGMDEMNRMEGICTLLCIPLPLFHLSFFHHLHLFPCCRV